MLPEAGGSTWLAEELQRKTRLSRNGLYAKPRSKTTAILNGLGKMHYAALTNSIAN